MSIIRCQDTNEIYYLKHSIVGCSSLNAVGFPVVDPRLLFPSYNLKIWMLQFGYLVNMLRVGLSLAGFPVSYLSPYITSLFIFSKENFPSLIPSH